ncbi:MAG: RsmE family RNA methyltransferase [Bacteroidetes bacterium]|nr:RsmE family RNA methyltransferase [Bacteroidota bacterium]
MHTCFVPELAVGLVALPEEEAQHVVRVLRTKPGDVLRLVDGEGRWAEAMVVGTNRKACQVRIDQVFIESETRPGGLVLVVAPTKSMDRFEWLLEKGTELGVEAFIPVWTERSERRIEKPDRWEKVLVAATKQCHRFWKPKLHAAVALSDMWTDHPWLQECQGAVAHCMSSISDIPSRVAWSDWQTSRSRAWLAIGPEGDFSEEEVRTMVLRGATPVHLGELRLRTETAGMSAAAQFGRFA